MNGKRGPTMTNERFDQTDVSSEKTRVAIRGLYKEFERAGGERVIPVHDIDLDVREGEILVLLGPSGCGKTTLLRCIAGLEKPEGGSIDIAGTRVFDAASSVMSPPSVRDVNMMFQSYALWPHMTLRDNVAFPLRMKGGASKRAARRRADEYLALVGLAGLGDQYAGNVSGGQQQRVALARTLISEPAVVLFDEPLSNVDAKVRAQLRSELIRIHQEHRFAAVYVTHDQIEAMGLGTRIAIMREGQIEQLAPPVTIYEEPASRYVAEFVGAANITEGVVLSAHSEVAVVDTPLGQIKLFRDSLSTPEPGTRVTLMIRPEHCLIDRGSTGLDADSSSRLRAIVQTSIYAGADTEYTCTVGDETLAVRESGAATPEPIGAEIDVYIPAQFVRVIRQ